MARAGAVWIDVIPNMQSFSRTIASSLGVSLKGQGAAAGRSFGSAMSTEVDRSASQSAALVERAATKAAAASAKQDGAVGRLRVAQLQLTEAQGKTSLSASQMAAAEERVAGATRANEIASANAARAAKGLATAQGGVGAETALTGTRFGGMASQAESAGRRAMSAVGGVGKQVLGLGGLFAGFAAVDFLSHSIAAAGDFQKQMMLLVTAGGEAQSNLGLVSNGIKSLAVSTGTSTGDLAEGMYVMEKAGLRGANGLLVLKAAAQGAKDENANLGVVTNGLTSVMTSYNIPASRANSVMNQMVVAAGASKTTMQDFSGSLSTVLPVASKAGVSFAEVGGAIATLTSHGTSADEATQHLAFAIRGLQAPNNVAVQMMSRFGINAQDVSTHLGKRGLAGTIDMLSQSIYARMGPAGVALQATFNNSKTASADAVKMFDNLPPAARRIASAYESGKLSLKDYRTEVKALPAPLAALLGQWTAGQNRAKGFNAQLLHGQQTSPTYVAAMQKMMGGAAGLQVALQLTGGSAGYMARTTAAVGLAARHNGKDIDAWKAAQQTFNVQLDRFKESVKVTAITVGTVLLPPLTRMARWLADTIPRVVAFVQANQGWIKPLLLTAAGVVALTVASAALNAVLSINPFVLVAAAVVALGVGLVMAYRHSQTFRDIVQAAFRDVRAAAVDVGRAAVWLWENAIHPALTSAGKLAVWLWQNAILPAFHGIEVAVHAVATAATWLWANVISPTFHYVAALASWMGNTFQAVALLIHDVLVRIVFPVVRLLYDAYVKPVFTAVATIATWLWREVLSPVFGWIGTKFEWLGRHVKTIWDTWLHPVFNIFGSALKDKLVADVQAAVKLIGAAWDGLQDLVKAPIKFVVSTVLNDGLIKGFNLISGAIGSNAHIDRIRLPKGFATGGRITGPGSGTSDSILARLSHGEFVVKASAAAQHADLLEAINGGPGAGRSAGSMRGFAGGGWIGNTWDKITNAGKDIWKALSDPAAALRKLIPGGMEGFPGQLGQLVRDVPGQLLSGAVDKLKSLIGLGGGGAPGAPGTPYGGPMPTGGAVTRWAPLVLSVLNELGLSGGLVPKVLRQIQTESGGNPNATQGAIGDINNRTGDLAKGLMQVIGTTFRAYAGPYASLGQYNPHASIYAGLNYAEHAYGRDLSYLGEGHGYARGGPVILREQQFDRGGLIQPGTTLVHNDTGSPEPAFSGPQWDILKRNTGSGGGDTHHHVHVEPQHSTVSLEDLQALQARQQVMDRVGRRR